MTCAAVPACFRSNAFSHTFLCIITVNISTKINRIVIFLPHSLPIFQVSSFTSNVYSSLCPADFQRYAILQNSFVVMVLFYIPWINQKRMMYSPEVHLLLFQIYFYIIHFTIKCTNFIYTIYIYNSFFTHKIHNFI